MIHAELTVKKEIENYLHPDCIQAVFGFPVVFGDMDDVPEIVARIHKMIMQSVQILGLVWIMI